VAISYSASPEIIWGLGGPEEDHQLHHCCWTGRVSEQEKEEDRWVFPLVLQFLPTQRHGTQTLISVSTTLICIWSYNLFCNCCKIDSLKLSP